MIAHILIHSSECPQIPSIFISNCEFGPYNKSCVLTDSKSTHFQLSKENLCANNRLNLDKIIALMTFTIIIIHEIFKFHKQKEKNL